jgi:hypothetical protein
VGDVALVPEGDVLEAYERVRPDDPRQPADPLGDDGEPKLDPPPDQKK